MRVVLGSNSKKNIEILSGFAEGKKMRSRLKLDQADAKGALVEVVIPERIMALTPSYFMGLFGPSIRRTCVEDFRIRYHFTCSDLIRRNIEDGIQAVLESEAS